MVVDHVNAAFSSAIAAEPERLKRWIDISLRFQNFRSPSLIGWNVQKLGKLDILLYCMEEKRDWFTRSDLVTSFQHLKLLSELWVGLSYSILFAVPADKRSEKMESLFSEVDCVRTVIEKYQIPKDSKIEKDAEGLRKISLFDADGNFSHFYNASDDTKSTILQSGLSEDGSCCWEYLEPRTLLSRWLTRRSISDRYLDLFD
ncbi:MAG: hypothetical protein INF18_03125 [Methylobacterium sp.]|nr:hypothetical protein [Methylobacterium sp.]MCA3638264.1 hypothetical protein [Methylobacterium sp.]